jgi:hypothetical protein
MGNEFKMTYVIGIEDTVVPHNDCGKKDVGVTAWFPDFVQRAVNISGDANRVIVKRADPYLLQELVEHRFFFWTGFVAESFKDFINGDSGDDGLFILPRMHGYPVNHRLIVGKEVG